MMDGVKIKVLKYVEMGQKPTTTYISNSLKNMQRTVGIEGETNTRIECLELPVNTKREIVAVMDDEGKLRQLPIVRGLRNKNGKIVDYIAGTFFVCAGEGGEFVGLTDDEVALVKEYFEGC